MAKPWIHAESSARKFGGAPEDYIKIHDLMDSSKEVFPDNRHRALTHNSWFIFICEKVFGHNITVDSGQPCDNCNGSVNKDYYDSDDTDGHIKAAFGGEQKEFMDTMCICNGTGVKPKQVSVRDICEQHILEDFGNKFIPTAQDYLEGMEFQDWMNNGVKGVPSSHKKIDSKPKNVKRMAFKLD